MQCIVVTPERTVYNKPAEFVVLTLQDGEIGIAPGHTPMIALLGWGEMRIRNQGETEHFYIEGGYVEVLEDVVSVLTEKAVPAAEIDESVAREKLATAQQRHAATPEEASARHSTVEQSRAQLQVARRARQ